MIDFLFLFGWILAKAEVLCIREEHDVTLTAALSFIRVVVVTRQNQQALYILNPLKTVSQQAQAQAQALRRASRPAFQRPIQSVDTIAPPIGLPVHLPTDNLSVIARCL